jgi:hypothetical protein
MTLAWVFILFTAYGHAIEIGAFQTEIDCNVTRKLIVIDRPKYWYTSNCYKVIR